MKYFSASILLLSSVALGACVPSGENTFIFNANNTVGGQLNGQPVVGTYTANANEVCSAYTAPQRLAGQELCSVPVIDGGTVVFNRRNGSSSPVYTIGG